LRDRPDSNEDGHAELIKRKGFEHEDRCLEALRERYGVPVTPPKASHSERMAATVAAMQRGAPLIAQAALGDQAWIGYADFLVRVDEPGRWSWSYEPWDASWRGRHGRLT
jgi:uncharacterized protein